MFNFHINEGHCFMQLEKLANLNIFMKDDNDYLLGTLKNITNWNLCAPR